MVTFGARRKANAAPRRGSSPPRAACGLPPRTDDFVGRRSQTLEMARGKLLDRERVPDPKNVDRSVNARAVDERHRNRGEPVIARRTAIEAAQEHRVARPVTALACLGENPVEPLWIA